MKGDITIAEVREAKEEAAKAIDDALMALWRRTGLEPRQVTFDTVGILICGKPHETHTNFAVHITLESP